MQEYHDGSYGPIIPLHELSERLADPKEAEKTRMVHIGTQEELEKLKEKSKQVFEIETAERLARLEMKVNKLLLHFGIKWEGLL